jgi:hypothetical protein
VELLAGLVSLSVPATAQQVTFVETFDTGNEGSWTYGAPGETIEPSGGNPGPYLRSPGIDTFAPRPHTQPFGVVSEFTGDFRARKVTQVGMDLITHYVDFSAADRNFSVILYSDNNTPADFDDDWGAYFVGADLIPEPGDGWRSFSFDIPSQETSLPAGWGFIQFGSSPPPFDWNALITKVRQLQFFYGDPMLLYIFQVWDVGLDNASITYEGFPCANGAVNSGCGAAEDILFLNATSGGTSRILQVTPSTPLSLAIQEPSSRQGDGMTTGCCVYAWLGEPDAGDTIVVPKGLGEMCFGPALLATRPAKKTWNSIGFPAKLGDDNAPGPPPVIPDGGTFQLFSFPGGLGQSLSVTFQGIVEDGCSQGAVPYSVTNGLVVRIGS